MVSQATPVPVAETSLPSYLAAVTVSILEPSALSTLGSNLHPAVGGLIRCGRACNRRHPGNLFRFRGVVFPGAERVVGPKCDDRHGQHRERYAQNFLHWLS